MPEGGSGNSEIQHKPRGRPFAKGVSGNPSGRPAGILSLIDRLDGPCAERSIQFIIDVRDGKITAPIRNPEPGEDAASAAMIPRRSASVRERYDAAVWLAERRNGTAPSNVSIEHSGTVEHVARDLSRLSDAELEIAEKLLEKSNAETIEGEAIEIRPVAEDPT